MLAALVGRDCPSMYDCRNLFQVNVEEGRHLWAMVYLQAYFGRDGRDEADELLARRSGDEDKPRILVPSTSPPMSGCRSSVSPCSQTATESTNSAPRRKCLRPARCKFMLTEEAHHLFVGETGLDRVVRRSAELTKLDPAEDARNQGGIDLITIQTSTTGTHSASICSAQR